MLISRRLAIALVIAVLPLLPYSALVGIAPPLPQALLAGVITPAPTRVLYIQEGAELVPFDAATLNALPNGQSINLGDAARPMPNILSTPSGSFLAAAYPGDAGTNGKTIVRIVDSGTGQIRSQLALPLQSVSVTADGSQFYGFEPVNGAHPRTVWAVYAGGRIHRVQLDLWCCLTAFYRPARHRLYIAEPSGPSGKSPLTLVLAAYNTLTGKEVQRLQLRAIRAGFWQTTRKVQGHPIAEMQGPGLDISPDGSQIAVLDGQRDLLTFVSTRTLRISRTAPITTPADALDRAAAWLGLGPGIAEAKTFQGENVDIRYSADGRFLYATGTKNTVRASWMPTVTALGIRAIDVRSGRIVASGLHGRSIYIQRVAADGSGIYVDAPTDSSPTAPEGLYRLDPTTLTPLASETATSNVPGGDAVLLTARPQTLSCQAPSPAHSGAIEGAAPRGSLWALGLGSLQAGVATKIVWRMTGTGALRMFAQQPDGTPVDPQWGPEYHIASTWSGLNPPGDDYGTGWMFPRAGCWRIHAARDNVAGDIWFRVAPSGGAG